MARSGIGWSTVLATLTASATFAICATSANAQGQAPIARSQLPSRTAATSAGVNTSKSSSMVGASSSVRLSPNTWIGGASVIAPSAFIVADPFPYSGLLANPVVNLGYPQPLGFQRISTGPNGYIYRPVTDLRMLVDQARGALKGADYELALVHLDPVLASAPDDGTAWMIRAQALFAAGSYAKAASALHMALRLLPRYAWGQPVTNPPEFFASDAEYAARLRALETYVATHPDEGAGHFLLGYHYGYRGRGTDANRELRTALRLATGSDKAAEALLAPTAGTPRPLEAQVQPSDAPSPGLAREDDTVVPPAHRPREF